MKNILLVCFLVFLIGVPFAEFIEELDVLVVDSNNRSMEGVSVWTNYQLNSIKGYVTTNKQYTGQDGIVHLKLINNEYQESLTKTDYTLFVEYMGEQQSHTVDVESGRRSRTYYINISQATIRVFDEYKGGLKANVTILDVTKETGDSGFVFFNLPGGEYGVIVNYANSVQKYPLLMEGDTLIEVPLTEYSLNVSLVDDKGSSLNGTIKVAEKTWDVYNGKVKIKFTAIPPVLIEGMADNNAVAKEINPKLVKEVIISIDTHEPEISGVTQTKTSSGYDLSLIISDTGTYATGVDTKINPPTLKYTITDKEEKGQERTLNLLNSNGDQYKISLTNIPENAVVDYEVLASDLSSNKVSYSNSFLASPPIQPIEKPKQNTTVIGPDSPGDLEIGEVFKWILIGLGFIVGILILYAVFKLKTEMKEENK